MTVQDNLTYIQRNLAPFVVTQLQRVNSQSGHSFNRVYQLEKDEKKALKRFYQPNLRKKSGQHKEVKLSHAYLQ